MEEKDVFPADFKRHVMKKYGRPSVNKDERIMESLMDLIFSSGQWRGNSLNSFLEKVAMIMQRHMLFGEVAIALKDRSDGKFRYQMTKGFSEKAITSHMKLEYTKEEIIDYTKYPAIKLGRNIVDLCSALLDQEEELKTYTAPALLESPRKSIDSMAEADYFNAYLYAGKQELIGFIEFTKTRDGNQPPRMMIKWVEFLCAIVAQIIWEKEYARKEKK